MKPLFTIHEGEFLVGDYIERKLGHGYDVWVPTKDSGVDILVTRKNLRGKAVRLQVKFSRDYFEKAPKDGLAGSFFSLDTKKLRGSRADLWVFVIMTFKHRSYFIVLPKEELLKRIPRSIGRRWMLYLTVCRGNKCYDLRGMNRSKVEETIRDGVGGRDRWRDYSAYLANWKLLDRDSSTQ